MVGNKYYKPYSQTSKELYYTLLIIRGLDDVAHWI